MAEWRCALDGQKVVSKQADKSQVEAHVTAEDKAGVYVPESISAEESAWMAGYAGYGSSKPAGVRASGTSGNKGASSTTKPPSKYREQWRRLA